MTNCNKRNQKSTVYAYNSTLQTVAVNGLVSIPNSDITGCAIEQVSNTNYKITCPGRYLVLVDAVVASSTTTGGSITAQLQVNGVSKPGALGSTNSTATTDVETISFATQITVLPNCPAIDNTVVLSLINTGLSANYVNITFNVIKLA